jgi:hypothetical protein
MKIGSLISIALFVFVSLALGGCGTKKMFTTTLDESSVSTRPALYIPPNFDLPPPQTGVEAPQEKKPVAKPSDDIKRPAVASSPAGAKTEDLTVSDKNFLNKLRKNKPLIK